MADEYAAFISYSSADVEWASRLHDDLAAKGHSLFVDRTRLEAGLEWEEQLSEALVSSRHLIVLWSQAAKQSDWVTAEIQEFKSHLRREVLDEPTKRRRIVQVCLEDSYTALGKYQAINRLRDEQVYPGSAEDVDAGIWDQTIADVDQAISPGDFSVPVTLVLLTLTNDDVERINDEAKPPVGGLRFGDFLTAIGMNRDQLRRCYGDELSEWKPFDANRTIGDILESVRERIIAHAPDHPLRWLSIEEEFWGDDADALERQIARLTSELAVVVVDPIALYDPGIRKRLAEMHRLLADEQTLITVLDPFPSPDGIDEIRDLLKSVSMDLFRHVFEREVPTPYIGALCGVNLRDVEELGRLVQFTFGRAVHVAGPVETPAEMRVANR